MIARISNLDTGVYYVDVFDQNGCKITSEFIYISQPANPLTIRVDSTDETCQLNDGIATAYVLGGTPPYTYNWDTTQETDDEDHVISVIVSDSSGNIGFVPPVSVYIDNEINDISPPTGRIID